MVRRPDNSGLGKLTFRESTLQRQSDVAAGTLSPAHADMVATPISATVPKHRSVGPALVGNWAKAMSEHPLPQHHPRPRRRTGTSRPSVPVPTLDSVGGWYARQRYVTFPESPPQRISAPACHFANGAVAPPWRIALVFVMPPGSLAVTSDNQIAIRASPKTALAHDSLRAQHLHRHHHDQCRQAHHHRQCGQHLHGDDRRRCGTGNFRHPHRQRPDHQLRHAGVDWHSPDERRHWHHQLRHPHQPLQDLHPARQPQEPRHDPQRARRAHRTRRHPGE